MLNAVEQKTIKIKYIPILIWYRFAIYHCSNPIVFYIILPSFLYKDKMGIKKSHEPIFLI